MLKIIEKLKDKIVKPKTIETVEDLRDVVGPDVKILGVIPELSEEGLKELKGEGKEVKYEEA